MKYLLPSILLLSVMSMPVYGQPALEKDYSTAMEIPSVIAMESSPAHMYVLSKTEGMVVFRARQDSLQWLYSSTGMEQRGNQVTADIRFAYLFGTGRRLTVLEPTSVLGVYSSTLLPARPLDAQRINQRLYVALGPEGLGYVSLRSPASVDSALMKVEHSRLEGREIADLESSRDQLFALSSDRGLFVFREDDRGLRLTNSYTLSRELEHIFLVDGLLLGSDLDGYIYEIDRSGNLSEIGSIGESVVQIARWKDWYIIKGVSNRLWTSYRDKSPVLWKDNGDAGNYFTVTGGHFWLSEYNNLSRINLAVTTADDDSVKTSSLPSQLNLKSIPDQVVPHSKPLLLALELEQSLPSDEVNFAYQSDVESAQIKGGGFYWEPTADDVGQHTFTIIASASNGARDQTTFSVDVRSFNAPPRFTPLRPLSIPVNERFTLPIRATDPDGMHPSLVRYLGVDLPAGATVDEETGAFEWTPQPRQVGENTFRVIATDRYGAASSVTLTIRVIDPANASSGGN